MADLEEILAGANNASVLVQSSIIVQEREHSQPSKPEQHLLTLGLRRKRLLHRAYKLLVQHPGELDDAIKTAWSAYVPGASGWRACPAVFTSADHWLMTATAALSQSASAHVHYNLLSGELLVNGLPLDQPPQNYRDHVLYSTLFGKAIVEVMPSTTAGFQFTTKRLFGGFAVQLGMSEDELIARATKDGEIYETIPQRYLKDCYPDSFVDGYVHWFNASTNTIQFRPIHDPWNASLTAAWILSPQQNASKWQLGKSDCFVAGIETRTSTWLAHVLNPLAHTSRIHCILEPAGENKVLHVSIPTLRLGFTLAQGSSWLESKEFRSFVADPDQTVGSLVGLCSKLVLKKHLIRHDRTEGMEPGESKEDRAEDGSQDKGRDRMVLVPESDAFTYSQRDGHTAVGVSRESIHRIHAVQVDTVLGRLLDNNDLGCKLYLAYLHALTSFCLVDPLTRKTGTEQALTILNSAAVRSFDQLTQENVDMLQKIALLSPGRCYYSQHKRVMQEVHWNNSIGFLSQHGHFITAVESLLEQAKKTLIFYPSVQLSFLPLDRTDQHLLERDNIRSATFRLPGFGAEDHSVSKYQHYLNVRDRNLLSKRATRASTMSHLIYRDGDCLSEPVPVAYHLWQTVQAVESVVGSQITASIGSKIRYSPNLLKDGHPFVLGWLPVLQRWLGNTTVSHRYRFSIIMWLSTIASASNSDMLLLQTIAMFFKSSVLAQVSVPQVQTFHPKEGITVSCNDLSRAVRIFLLPLNSCPENQLPRAVNERQGVYNKRRRSEWQAASNSSLTFCGRSLYSMALRGSKQAGWCPSCLHQSRRSHGCSQINLQDAVRQLTARPVLQFSQEENG